MATNRFWRHRRCSLEYHLPISCVRFKGDVTYTTDEFAADPTEPKEAAKSTAALEVMAADEPRLKLDVQPWRLCDTKISAALTDDLRLTTAGFSSTGQAGQVLLGVATAVAAVAGAAMGAGVPGVTAAAGGGGQSFAGDLEMDMLAIDKGKKLPKLKDPWQEYQKDQPERAKLLETYRATVSALERALAEEAGKLAATTALDSSSRLRSLEKALVTAQAECDRLNSRYDTWRAGKISTRTEQYEYVLSLDDLGKGCSVDHSGTITFDASAPGKAAQERVWDKLGIAVRIGPEDARPQAGQARAASPQPGQRPNRVIARIPRLTEIAIFERVGAKQDGKARLVESRPYLIMDRDCRFQAIRLHSSLFGKKTDDLTFSALGGLATYSTERTSGAADLAQTLGKLPETVTSGFEQSGKMLDQVSGLRGRALKQQIASLQAQIDLKKAQIDLGGLEATESRAAELALLQQQLAFALAQYNIANPGGG